MKPFKNKMLLTQKTKGIEIIILDDSAKRAKDDHIRDWTPTGEQSAETKAKEKFYKALRGEK